MIDTDHKPNLGLKQSYTVRLSGAYFNNNKTPKNSTHIKDLKSLYLDKKYVILFDQIALILFYCHNS